MDTAADGRFTDPVDITGPVTNEELSLRSSIGVFVFVPPVNERLIEQAGLHLVWQEDGTASRSHPRCGTPKDFHDAV